MARGGGDTARAGDTTSPREGRGRQPPPPHEQKNDEFQSLFELPSAKKSCKLFPGRAKKVSRAGRSAPLRAVAERSLATRTFRGDFRAARGQSKRQHRCESARQGGEQEGGGRAGPSHPLRLPAPSPPPSASAPQEPPKCQNTDKPMQFSQSLQRAAKDTGFRQAPAILPKSSKSRQRCAIRTSPASFRECSCPAGHDAGADGVSGACDRTSPANQGRTFRAFSQTKS